MRRSVFAGNRSPAGGARPAHGAAFCLIYDWLTHYCNEHALARVADRPARHET